MMTLLQVNYENNAEEFWSMLRAQLPNVGIRLGFHNTEVEVDDAELMEILQLPGMEDENENPPMIIVDA